MANAGTRGFFKVGALVGRGSTYWFPLGSAPSNGTSGTLAGDAAPGSSVVDYVNGIKYTNTGTQASPVWTQDIRIARVTLTNANMLALRATPITLVAAPGANKRIQYLGATLNLDASAGAYTETADNMAVKFTNGSGVAVSATIEATGFVDQAAKMHSQSIPVVDAIVAEAGCVNQALVLHNTGDGEYGGGNAANSLVVNVTYRVIVTV